ncbi:MAG: glycogen debranching protein GlgX [Kiritimatiellae bacterium]|nr:glycogen debranching protein GlgX [Kiritimatiellia bacterium]
MKKKHHVIPGVPVPVPYGAHVVEHGVHFSIFSRHATRVWLLLFAHADDETPSEEFELDPERNRLGDLWHLHVPTARPGQYYVYRMDGPRDGPDGHAYDPQQWLLDPYALAVAGQEKWGDHEGITPGQVIRSGRLFPKGIILKEDGFDWSGDRTLRVPLNESVIYEASVRGYTAHASAGARHPGTYRALIDKIPYLQELGVTTLELLPVQEFNEMELLWENGSRRHLRNFWGYSTLAFFAPNGRFACANQRGEQVREFKEMVLAMHRAGIEVILDVVFNHTAEGGMGGQTFSFRGIDNTIYYMLEDDGQRYKNFTGCGNTVNGNHPVARDFILHCLRYWVLHMRVDGFRFDLATILARGQNGDLLANPPVIEQIAEDPVLRGVKIIAEAWDAAGAYQVGSFPSERWSEWNGRYRDDMRKFWLGSASLSTFATRLCGSPDLYDRPGQSPNKSVNYIAAHDGFTLADMVSYNHKHNQANCEDNRDGDNHNHSHNFGHEGPTAHPGIRAQRLRRQKNLLATLFLSQGVPKLLGGDEFGRTQQGSNNAYCQDNDISWVDWDFLRRHRSLYDFTRRLIAFRAAHPALMRTRFFSGEAREGDEPDIRWCDPAGDAPDWGQGDALACRLDGRPECIGADQSDDDLYVIFNRGDEPLEFALPANADDRPWSLAVTTQDSPPVFSGRARSRLTVDAQSVTVLTHSRLKKSSK